jgi:hypothetical protein
VTAKQHNRIFYPGNKQRNDISKCQFLVFVLLYSHNGNYTEKRKPAERQSTQSQGSKLYEYDSRLPSSYDHDKDFSPTARGGMYFARHHL